MHFLWCPLKTTKIEYPQKRNTHLLFHVLLLRCDWDALFGLGSAALSFSHASCCGWEARDQRKVLQRGKHFFL